MDRSRTWLAPPPLPEEVARDPVLTYQWLLETWFVRLRWLALPLCVAAVPFFLGAAWPLLVVCPLALGLGNAWLVWRLRRAAGGACLRQVRAVATGLDWALALVALGLSAGAPVHEALPAVLLLLLLATGLRYGPSGLLGAAAGTALLTALVVALHVVLLGALTAHAASALLAGWEFLIALTALLGWGLLRTREEWYRQDEERVARRDTNARRLESGLSRREWELLPLLARRDLTYAAIAERLHIGEETVKTHVRHIEQKWGVTKRAGIVAEARRRGLLRPGEGPGT